MSSHLSLCSRWGYKTLDDVKTVVAKYAESEIPLDTMWTDIVIQCIMI